MNNAKYKYFWLILLLLILQVNCRSDFTFMVCTNKYVCDKLIQCNELWVHNLSDKVLCIDKNAIFETEDPDWSLNPKGNISK